MLFTINQKEKKWSPREENQVKTTDKERGDLEIKDYVILKTPQEQVNLFPPPRTLILDFTLTHTRFGRSNLHPIGQRTHRGTRRSDGTPER